MPQKKSSPSFSRSMLETKVVCNEKTRIVSEALLNKAKKTEKITQNDIANRAGISKSSMSRYVNNRNNKNNAYTVPISKLFQFALGVKAGSKGLLMLLETVRDQSVLYDAIQDNTLDTFINVVKWTDKPLYYCLIAIKEGSNVTSLDSTLVDIGYPPLSRYNSVDAAPE